MSGKQSAQDAAAAPPIRRAHSEARPSHNHKKTSVNQKHLSVPTLEHPTNKILATQARMASQRPLLSADDASDASKDLYQNAVDAGNDADADTNANAANAANGSTHTPDADENDANHVHVQRNEYMVLATKIAHEVVEKALAKYEADKQKQARAIRTSENERKWILHAEKHNRKVVELARRRAVFARGILEREQENIRVMGLADVGKKWLFAMVILCWVWLRIKLGYPPPRVTGGAARYAQVPNGATHAFHVFDDVERAMTEHAEKLNTSVTINKLKKRGHPIIVLTPSDAVADHVREMEEGGSRVPVNYQFDGIRISQQDDAGPSTSTST
ncbi:hypothetical protein EG329_000770 [Mollisiaceae sp. DMI_Dod_QoI]|nr:hypothetical protein EG329_000770 [Helotiales sp. DMI_Dod_QoI]